ncbi:autotransporter-associated beta strand repeat protein [Pirellula staleyi DSM 6068]|uniref:Autotransporter-associated beta strand repeat protein n=1 Tax=Pirellula staleyi (strain ATCC 27377 / DSM 6068 / ICPB 4128) TaxID=530564 RepID=D2R336_PIRSD|nr:autotransporter-associated beta strand repeat-containing protein [Pirellula staleyi]ADB18769.1 autotransporter-associated beta strand repeat protein [Pirellula staleyi DSM 6068]
MSIRSNRSSSTDYSTASKSTNKSQREAHAKSRMQSPKRRAFRRMLVESLEQRQVMATLVWDGGGDAINFADSANWDLLGVDQAPTSGDTLVFGGAAAGTLINNTTPGNTYAMQFNAPGYVITGNSITLNQAVSDLATTSMVPNGFAIRSSAGVNNTVNTPLILSGSNTIDVAASTGFATGGAISGGGSLTKTSNGQYTLRGANTFGGGVVHTAGAIRAEHAQAFGTGTISVTGTAVTLLWWNTPYQRVENNWILSGTGGFDSKTAIYADGAGGGSPDITLAGTITLVGSGSIGGNSANNITVTGQITGAGSLVKGGSRGDENSTLTLMNPANNYTGGTTINRGTLKAGANEVIPHAAGNQVVTVGAGTALDLSVFSETINSLAGTGTVRRTGGVIPLTNFTGDADSDISLAKTYTHKLDFNAGATVATVNGVAFDAGVQVGPNYTLNATAAAAGVPTGVTPPTDGTSVLLEDFYYNANPTQVTLTGLTPGTMYEVRLYHRRWQPYTNRTQRFVFDEDGAGVASTILYHDVDASATPNYMTYRYIATGSAMTINVHLANNTSSTYHIYGLTNEVVSGSLTTPTLLVSGTTDNSFNGTLDGYGTIQKSGSNTQGFGGTGSFAGNLNVTQGSISVGSATGLASANVNVSSGANVRLNYGSGNGVIANNFTLQGLGTAGDGKSTIYGDGGGSGLAEYVLSGTITLGSNASIGGNDQNHITVTGQVTGAGGLFKGQTRSDEASTLTLTNPANNYQGGTVINRGRLRTGANEVIPHTLASNSLVVGAGTSVDFGIYTETIGSLSGSGNLMRSGSVLAPVLFDSDATSGISSSKTYTHALDFNAGASVATINGVNFTNAGNSGGNWTLTGAGFAFSNTSTGILSPTDGTHTLLEDFLYAGNPAVLTLSGLVPGTTYETRLYNRRWGADDRTNVLIFDEDGAGPASTTIRFNEDASATPNYLTYRFVATSSSVAISFRPNNSTTASYHFYGVTNEVVAAPATPQLSIVQTTNGLFSGAISGVGSVEKQGAASLTLSGASTYSGGTTITGGILLASNASGSATGTGPVQGSGASTLGGTGSITGAVTLAATSTLAPGASPETLATGNLALGNNTALAIEIGGTAPGNGVTGYDQVNVTGTVSIGSGVALNLTQLSGFTVNPAALQTFTIVSNDGSDAVTGTFAGLAEGAAISYAGGTLYISYAGGDGNDIVLSSQPLLAGTSLADEFVITGDGTTYTVTRTNSSGVVTAVYTNPVAQILNILGAGGDDTLIVRSSGASTDPIPTGGIVFDGQAQTMSLFGDTLRVEGASSQTATYVPSSTTFGSGTVTIAGIGVITFVGLEPLDLSGFGVANVNFPNANEIISINTGFDSATGTIPALVVSGSSGGVSFEQVHLSGNTVVNIDTVASGVDGADLITIAGAANAHGNTNLNINAGAGADIIDVNGLMSVVGATSSIALTSGGSINVNSTITAGLSVNLSAGTGSITDGNGATANVVTTVAGGSLVASAAQGINLDTSVVNLTATNSTSGTVNIDDADGLNIQSVTNNNAPVVITAAGIGNVVVENLNAGTGAVTILVNNGNIESGAADGGAADIVGGVTTLTLTQTSRRIGNGAANRLEINATQLIVTGGAAGTQTTPNQVHIVDTAGGLSISDSSIGAADNTVFDLLVQNGSLVGDGETDRDIGAVTIILEVTGATSTIGALTAGLRINAATTTPGGRVDAKTAGTAASNITLVDTTDNFPIGVIDAGLGDVRLVTLNSGAVITDNANDALVDIIANRLWFESIAGVGVGSLGNLETQVNNLEATTGTGGIGLANTGNVTLGGATATVTGVRATTGGSINVSSTGNIIISETVTTAGTNNNITLTAAGSLTSNAVISSTGLLGVTANGGTLSTTAAMTSSGTLTAFSTGNMSIGGTTTSTAGDVSLTSSGGTFLSSAAISSAGLFTGSSAGSFTANSTITSVGNLTATAGGDMTINANLTASGGASSVLLTTTDSAASQNFLLEGSTLATISAGTSITINAGDNATLEAGSRLAAGTTVSVTIDAASADVGGATLSFAGDIDAVSATFTGGAEIDTFNVRPDQDNGLASTPISIFGGDPTMPAGDLLVLDITGLGVPTLTLGAVNYSGVWSFGASAAGVAYSSIETVQTTPLTSVYNLVLDMRIAGFQNGAADAIEIFLSAPNVFEVEVNGLGKFSGQADTINSFTVIGSSDSESLTIRETAAGLPSFDGAAPLVDNSLASGGVSNGAHLNIAADAYYTASNLTDVTIHFDGGLGDNSLALELLTAADVGYFSDVLDGQGSGNVGVGPSGAPLTLVSFADLDTLILDGAGGNLVVDASSSTSTADIEISDDGAAADGVTEITADTGLVATTTFEGFLALDLIAGGGNEAIDLVNIDSTSSLTSIDIVAGSSLAATDNSAHTVRIHAIKSGVPVTVTGDIGVDTFQVFDSGNSASNIASTLSFNGVAGDDDSLIVVDSGSVSADSVVITRTTIEGLTIATGTDITFTSIDDLDVTTSGGADTIRVNMTEAANDLDTAVVSGANSNDQFYVNAADFLARLTLNGGLGDDTFGGTPSSTAPGYLLSASELDGVDDMIRPSLTTPFFINGNDPSVLPGDVLNIDVSALGGGLAATSPVLVSSGQVLSSTHATVTFTTIEDLNLADDGEMTSATVSDIYIRGTNGNDTIQFARANTTLEPNRTRVQIGSSYTYHNVPGKTLVYGRGGNDIINQSNLQIPAEFYGEAGDDFLTGSFNNDLLVGGLGNDRINASSGNNIVWGDDAPTSDELNPHELNIGGNDTLSALGGNDIFYAGGGNDSVSPGAGDDWIHGGYGNDQLSGSSGNDRIYGAQGNDTISGDVGDDFLSGGDGDDRLYGRDGNDVLIGGDGVDLVDGGNGNDLVLAAITTYQGTSDTATSNTYNSAVDAAMLALLVAWNSGGPVAANLTHTDDFDRDTVYGGSGNDLFGTHTNADPLTSDIRGDFNNSQDTSL